MSDSIAGELKQALVDVEDASIPEDLRAVAFASAFWAARESATPKPGEGKGAPPQPALDADSGASAVSTEPEHGGVEKIAAKLNVPSEDVEAVFDIRGNELGLNVPASRFASSPREAIEQIVYLIAAGRQALGLEARTTTPVIKVVCKDRGKTNSNFGRYVDDLHGKGVTVGGSGHARTIGVNAVGFERAGEIVKQLSGPGD
jgi:hypothetical protein